MDRGSLFDQWGTDYGRQFIRNRNWLSICIISRRRHYLADKQFFAIVQHCVIRGRIGFVCWREIPVQWVFRRTCGSSAGFFQSVTSFNNVTGLACSADGTKVYAAGTSGFIFYSPDSGVDWFQRNQSGNWTGLACSSDGSKVVAGSSGNVFTSSNFGANWTQRSIQARYVACSSDGNRIIAAQPNGPGQYFFKDFGATWTQSLSGLNWSSVASSADGTRLVVTVNNGVIYTSTDSGNSWIAQNSGSRNWFSVACSADGTKLMAGVNFGQIWTSQLTTTTSSTTGTSGYLQGLNFSTIQLLYMGSGVWNTITSRQHRAGVLDLC